MSDVTDEVILERLKPWRFLYTQVFQHYKTKAYYVVDAVSLMEEDMETVMVTYHPMRKPDMSFIRTVENFCENVPSEEGRVARFAPLNRYE